MPVNQKDALFAYYLYGATAVYAIGRGWPDPGESSRFEAEWTHPFGRLLAIILLDSAFPGLTGSSQPADSSCVDGEKPSCKANTTSL